MLFLSSIDDKFRKLPPEMQKEVMDFIDFLLQKVQGKKEKLKLTWQGGLKEFRDKYTSLELQRKALEWWGD